MKDNYITGVSGQSLCQPGWKREEDSLRSRLLLSSEQSAELLAGLLAKLSSELSFELSFELR